MAENPRTVPLSEVAAGLEALRIARSRQVHIFAHDVGNSLLAAKLNTEALGAQNDSPPLRDLKEAVAEIERLVTELKHAVDAELGLIELAPVSAELTAIGPVTASAPRDLEIDPLVLHEIVRELSTGAAPHVEGNAAEAVLVFPTPDLGADRRHYARAAKLLESIGGALEVRPASVVARIKRTAAG